MVSAPRPRAVISTRSREASRHRARESFAHEGPPAVKGQNMAELVVLALITSPRRTAPSWNWHGCRRTI